MDADKTEVWLQWEWPERTGGSEITGFIVEHQEEGSTDWVTFKTVSNPQCHVTGLVEGKTYRFRVKSQNAIGISRPDTTVPITCQEKTCKIYNIFYYIILFFIEKLQHNITFNYDNILFQWLQLLKLM